MEKKKTNEKTPVKMLIQDMHSGKSTCPNERLEDEGIQTSFMHFRPCVRDKKNFFASFPFNLPQFWA